MTKTYKVDFGFHVRKGDAWFDSGRLITIHNNETIEIFVAPRGQRGECIGTYSYDTLVRDRPPRGLGIV